MTERLLLVDSDVFVLLGAAGLLDELAVALGFTPDAIRRLPALPHQLRKGRTFRRYDESARQAAGVRCDVALPLDERPDTATFDRLLSVDGIDEGEAFFFATLAERPACLLTTGDGRSLVALGQAPELQDVRDQVRGRIVPLEAALILLVRRLGATVVGARLKPLAAIHRTIDIVFGTKDEFDEVETVRQITSYLDSLRQSMGDDLLYPVE